MSRIESDLRHLRGLRGEGRQVTEISIVPNPLVGLLMQFPLLGLTRMVLTNRYLVVGRENGCLSILELTGFVTSEMAAHSQPVYDIVPCPFDNGVVASVGADSRLIVSIVRSGRILQKNVLPVVLWSVAYVNRFRLAVGGVGGTVFIVDRDGRILFRFVLEAGPPVSALFRYRDELYASSVKGTRLLQEDGLAGCELPPFRTVCACGSSLAGVIVERGSVSLTVIAGTDRRQALSCPLPENGAVPRPAIVEVPGGVVYALPGLGIARLRGGSERDLSPPWASLDGIVDAALRVVDGAVLLACGNREGVQLWTLPL